MRSKAIHFLCLGALAAASAAAAAPRIPGPEMQVNAVSTHVEQRHPTAAYAANGAAVVVWEDVQAGIKARFLARNGHTVGADLTLVSNQLLTAIPSHGNVIYRRNPAVTFLPNGSFALFWTEETDFEQLDAFLQQDTLLRRDVFGRFFSATGTPQGPAFRVNGAGERVTGGVQVAVRAGDLLVAWHNQGNGKNVFARRYDLSGHAVGDEVQVNVGHPGAANPAIAVARNGRSAIAYEAGDVSGLGIYVQLYDASFHPQGDAVRVNAALSSDQRRPAIAVNAAGQYLVAWQRQYRSPLSARVFGQVVGEAGNLIGGQLALSGGSNRYEVTPSVAAGQHGDFVLVWLAFDASLPTGIYANQVDALGRPGSEVQINQRSINFNTRSSLVTDGSGHFLAPWEGFAGNDPAISAQLLAD